MDDSPITRFWMIADEDRDGVIHLRLIGELDMSSSGDLTRRLAHLSATRAPLRLDLSRLDFIDCGGLREIWSAVVAARNEDRSFQIGCGLRPLVRRALELSGVGEQLRLVLVSAKGAGVPVRGLAAPRRPARRQPHPDDACSDGDRRCRSHPDLHGSSPWVHRRNSHGPGKRL